MIYHLRGKIIEKKDKAIVIDVNGLGYIVSATNELLNQAFENKEMTVLTAHIIREDSEELYGFANITEKSFFELLINISGIGPKTAINVINSAPMSSLISAIRAGESSHLLKVSGIGRKIAEKIILELREKIEILGFDQFAKDIPNDIDAIDALKSIGYSTEESRKALRQIGSEIVGTENRIKAVLKILAK